MSDANNTQNKDREEFKKIIKELRPIDDEFMRLMFKDDIPLMQHVLRIILDKDDLIVTEIETQRNLKKLAGGRSICLDVYATDSENKKYDIEIQRNDSGATPHRARYHLGAIDVENLNSGQDFKELPDTYIIFITENDYFGKGEPLYIFEKMNIKSHEPLNDGAHIIYVNGQYRGDGDIGKLMHDFCCADPDKMYFVDMAERAKIFKENKKGEIQMSGILERKKIEWFNEGVEAGLQKGVEQGVQQGVERGILQGIEENKKDTARKMLAAGIFTAKQVAEYSGLDVKQVEKIKNSLLN